MRRDIYLSVSSAGWGSLLDADDAVAIRFFPFPTQLQQHWRRGVLTTAQKIASARRPLKS